MAGGKKGVVLEGEMNARLSDYQERRREGRFRELFTVTHEEFLEMSREDVEWLLLIDTALTEGAIEQAKRDAKS